MRYVTEAEMDAVAPGAYAIIPAQFRDRIPHGIKASPRNSDLFRRGFGFLQTFVDRLFERLKYTEGDHWPQWKLTAAFYLAEEQVGTETIRMMGRNVFATIPWPSQVKTITDAFFSTEAAFRGVHEGTLEQIGGFPCIAAERGKVLINNCTQYPCHLEEGTIAGICDAFARARPKYTILPSPKPKRLGGTQTWYQITFDPT